MGSKAEKAREDARLRALRLIEARPRITQRELASELGISLGAAHYMLRALMERGLIKLRRFSASQNKQGYVYVLTPSGITEKAVIAARFLVRKRAEYEALRAEIDELAAELDASGAPSSEQGCN
ncbi:MarR family EPS-associated transcriptional regulator [Leptolyngbya sp. AN03gr2]|uniref:MarR family EPS-associated transcriptional regulator n=1 Tax=Leptolyngbya sp. AN03gr2 TaxID=3423364 RepID=UPI003D31D9DE